MAQDRILLPRGEQAAQKACISWASAEREGNQMSSHFLWFALANLSPIPSRSLLKDSKLSMEVVHLLHPPIHDLDVRALCIALQACARPDKRVDVHGIMLGRMRHEESLEERAGVSVVDVEHGKVVMHRLLLQAQCELR